MRDITERKQAEEALRKCEEKYQMVTQNIHEMFYAVKGNGHPYGGSVQLVSDQVRNVVGREPYEFVQDPTLWPRLIYPDDMPGAVEATNKIIASKKPGTLEYRVQHKKTGEYRWITDRIVPRFNDSDKLVNIFGTVRDVTERKQLEAQLLQSQKMEAMGRVVAGVAHDFNNLLLVIKGHSFFLRNSLSHDEGLAGTAEQIEEAVDRAASLIQQLLVFGPRQVFQPRVLELNTVVSSTSILLRHLLGEPIDLVISLAPALGWIKADPGQIERVIINLAVNARDAMPQGGKLIIGTANAELDESYARHHVPVKPGSYVILTVTDTGIGMDEETQARIFDPFFTTKEPGKGTGLGLATVDEIVKQSGGYVLVSSEPEWGTTFEVYLPRVELPAAPVSLDKAEEAVKGGGETVLLVEDEEGVLKVEREFLERWGYHTLVAGNAAAALEVAERHRGPIHLLVTDVVMPDMNGRELAQRLVQLRPDLKVLYASGSTDNVIMDHGVLVPGTAFLHKPFTGQALVRKVREVLDTREL